MTGMHHVSRINPATAKTPPLYLQHSTGFRRATYVDRAMGSVHMGVGICYLDPGGVIQPHVHSFEESFYILEGNLEGSNVVQIGEKSHTPGAGSLRIDQHGSAIMRGATLDHPAIRPAVWLEMQAPQPRPARIRQGHVLHQRRRVRRPQDSALRPLRRIPIAAPRRACADGRIQPDHRRRHQDVRGSFVWSDPPVAVPDPVHAGREDRSARSHLRGVLPDCQRPRAARSPMARATIWARAM